jgi:FAD/FMN-containing dehydrogenase
MTRGVFDRLQALLGPSQVERDAGGLPRAVPEHAEALAAVCAAASEEGWRLRIEGNATWLQPDAPAEVVVSTRGMTRIVSISPADLVATVEGGVSLAALRAALAEQKMWLALDPPGRPERTIGSIVATGTTGPLRGGFGPVRDHVLGSSVVTGDGRVVSAGGRVVKNVAGYDLTKLHVGGFGGFGMITSVHLRLRALPASDLTLVARGNRDALVAAGRAAIEAQIGSVALELLSPALGAHAEWSLAARMAGTAEVAESEARRLKTSVALDWELVPAERTGAFWNRSGLGGAVTLRLGALLDGVEDSIDLLREQLDEGLVSAGIGSGSIRWAGDATTDQLRRFRLIAATREIPVTLERAPWAFRQAVGHFGAYREGVGQLVSRLRQTFDPRGVFVVAMEGSEVSGER